MRYLLLHPDTAVLMYGCIAHAGHDTEEGGALFRPILNNLTEETEKAITANCVYRIVHGYSAAIGFEIRTHPLHATAATNALDHQADIAKSRRWLGQPNISITRLYRHRRAPPEEGLTFKITQ